ncbi:ferredoxin [Streptomyces acidiscabies]|uniref:Ferredoxin n=1 Tax=Streptomyces acidiscabies TaxID=42234 RepID=A0AAP6BDI8_9ACTN|nr:ferredoxin [Streptomyces acidiscabies]MBP5934727.1 ferredoxin [Streptomyces sp. LBUM 1476]MBZ3917542.1 ferredoxin [Streptomyces acidiscabies]MDX2962773.1 ferredoxin [Streptomyces acidiscabies]MDX3018920.1 ferredoxin [Streptomyces acidiscabies]MDX3790408.1 ferredoxin [Streptomyces acidiscabies]
MQVELEADKCVASGQCVLAAMDVFDQDDDGIAVLLEAEPAADQLDDVREAVAVCPAGAIRLVEKPQVT